MVTKQFMGSPEDADLRRADSLALTQNLRVLERDGLVQRKVHPAVPPWVAFSLTEPGPALRAMVDGMCGGTHEYLGHIEAARRRFDA
ncbi:winged helix-turn-helix transcriptional regulator [Streptomyces olivochromogenes]|uniref:winged helix-turn-helix transcriptional regulator n=1 Tax=Streptomyces olivochromogenes TaxID=1963 RepID=UPI001F2E3697|nr:winged helix-turn-helix transcriptional regulator [Streptomyces olivochromogenes]MCF3132760.1 winged helix-turn-helix transcriptional regulator [Streptomyces olivochromogenes]